MVDEHRYGVFYDITAGFDYAVVALLKYNGKECILVDTIKIKRPDDVDDKTWENTVLFYVKKLIHKYEISTFRNADESNDKTKSKRKRKPNK